jgi:hypothetical protein
MEPRELKISTFSKEQLLIFRCVMSFVPAFFIYIYLVLSPLIFSPTRVASFCNLWNISLRAFGDLARRATSSA